ncbi:hypothetical protein Tco_0979429 [Tanacetum coccineum]
MAFGGNTRDLGSFGEETDKITDLHQILEEVLLTERGDGVAGIKRRRRDPSSDGVRDLVTASGRTRKALCVYFNFPFAIKLEIGLNIFQQDPSPQGDSTTLFPSWLQIFPPGGTAKLRNDILIRTIDQSAGGKLRDRNAKESWALLEDLALYDNESWNGPRVISLRPVSNRFASYSRETISKKLNDAPVLESVVDSMAFENIASISHIEREELRRKGIKIPSKLFSPKYLSPTSRTELYKNPLAPKRVHFFNSIVILSEESETEEGETTTNITPEHDHNITKEAKDEEGSSNTNCQTAQQSYTILPDNGAKN